MKTTRIVSHAQTQDVSNVSLSTQTVVLNVMLDLLLWKENALTSAQKEECLSIQKVGVPSVRPVAEAVPWTLLFLTKTRT